MVVYLTKKQINEIFQDFFENISTEEYEKFLIKNLKNFSKFEYAYFTGIKKVVDQLYKDNQEDENNEELKDEES